VPPRHQRRRGSARRLPQQDDVRRHRGGSHRGRRPARLEERGAVGWATRWRRPLHRHDGAPRIVHPWALRQPGLPCRWRPFVSWGLVVLVVVRHACCRQACRAAPRPTQPHVAPPRTTLIPLRKVMRKDADGGWSWKLPNTPASNRDLEGARITDPDSQPLPGCAARCVWLCCAACMCFACMHVCCMCVCVCVCVHACASIAWTWRSL
jgi:hypothetical protein